MSFQTSTSSQHCRILCVDDEPAIRDVLRALLLRDGFEIETAVNGAEAWAQLSRDFSAVDLLITDNEMPELFGVELVERLRAAHFPGRIIVFSSSLTPDDITRLEACGVDAIIEKGRAVSALLDEVRRAANAVSHREG